MTSDPITLRLRRANPVPRAVAVEADELFAAITAARPDRRLRREVRHRQRVLVAQNAWECYWVHAIREGDNAAAARAQSVLTGLLAQNVLEAPVGASENWTPPNPPDRPYVVFAADGGLDWVRQTYALAAAG